MSPIQQMKCTSERTRQGPPGTRRTQRRTQKILSEIQGAVNQIIKILLALALLARTAENDTENAPPGTNQETNNDQENMMQGKEGIAKPGLQQSVPQPKPPCTKKAAPGDIFPFPPPARRMYRWRSHFRTTDSDI